MFTSALDMVLGSFSGGYNENKSYVVVANQLGGVFRIDYLIVSKNFLSVIPRSRNNRNIKRFKFMDYCLLFCQQSFHCLLE